MDFNIYINKELYSYHFTLDGRTRRIDDFLIIYEKLKNHLIPTSRTKINGTKINEYIELYQEENKTFIKTLLNTIYHINFEKFLTDTYEQLTILNDKLKNNF